ncbi:MAG: hypothetical protein HGA53_06675 [Anaerolineaceae bacterium]|nr:hypothetical protein [Anaerolineaceae bacterium]NTV36621.1 hypothetical protein [Anaerolineaceae bacterium]
MYQDIYTSMVVYQKRMLDEAEQRRILIAINANDPKKSLGSRFLVWIAERMIAAGQSIKETAQPRQFNDVFTATGAKL